MKKGIKKPPLKIQKSMADKANPMIDGFAVKINFSNIMLAKVLFDSYTFQDSLLVGVAPLFGYGVGGYGIVIYDGSGSIAVLVTDADLSWDDSGISPSKDYQIVVAETMTPDSSIVIQ